MSVTLEEFARANTFPRSPFKKKSHSDVVCRDGNNLKLINNTSSVIKIAARTSSPFIVMVMLTPLFPPLRVIWDWFISMYRSYKWRYSTECSLEICNQNEFIQIQKIFASKHSQFLTLADGRDI